MLKPLNDTILVELEGQGQWATAEAEDGYKKGTVIEISQVMAHFGSHGWSLDNSLMPKTEEGVKFYDGVREWFNHLVGKKVYWEQHADAGVTIDHEGKKYAIIKITKLIAVEE